MTEVAAWYYARGMAEVTTAISKQPQVATTVRTNMWEWYPHQQGMQVIPAGGGRVLGWKKNSRTPAYNEGLLEARSKMAAAKPAALREMFPSSFATRVQ